MRLKEFIETIDEKKQYRLALDFTERTLTIWDAYAKRSKLEYVDTVVGMHHIVKADILSRTLETIKRELESCGSQKKKIGQLREEFSDPISAMQDLDFELPYAVEQTFYAVHNLLEKVSGQVKTVFGEPQIYVVINQAIDALEKSGILTEDEIKEILKKYKNGG